MKPVIALLAMLFAASAWADTPPARQVKSETLDGAANAITSTSDSGKRGLDCHVSNLTAAPLPSSVIVSGSAVDPRSIRALTTADQVACGQLGSWSVIVSSSALPTGAATSALQTTGNTSLSSIDTKLTSQATAANQATANSSLASLDGKSPALVTGRVPVDGSAVTQPVSGTFWQVTQPVSGTFFQATQPVSAASLPLPTGASTSANQSTTNTTLSSIDTKTPALVTGRVPVDGSGVTQPVSGTFWQATQPVSAASLPLPSGAATAAKQPALGTAGTASADVISVQGIASMTALKVDGSAVTQPISAASLPLPSGAATSANQTTANTSLSSIDTKTPALGQTTMASSVPVAIASNQTAIPVMGTVAVGSAPTTAPVSIALVDGGGLKRHFLGDTSGRLEIDTAQSLPLPTGAATAANQATANTSLSTISGQLPATLGTKTTANSTAVNIASDDTVSITPTDGVKATYSASVVAFATAASATDIFTITGSGTKTVRVTDISLTCNMTAGQYENVVLLKRSTADSGGTPGTPTIVPLDSNDAAATAVVNDYTANPTTGTLIGNLRVEKVPFGTPTLAATGGLSNPVGPGGFRWTSGLNNGKAIVLRGTSQVLALNLNAVTVTGSSCDAWVEWTEE